MADTKAKVELTLDIEKEVFEGDFECKVITTTELCKKINALFKSTLWGYIGCEIIVAPASPNMPNNIDFITQQLSVSQDCNAFNKNRPPYLVLYFKDIKMPDGTGKIKALEPFNSTKGENGIEYLNKISNAQNSFRRYSFSDHAKKFLERFINMRKGEEIKWDDDSNNETRFVYEIVNNEPSGSFITVKVVGLDINKILYDLFVPKNGSTVMYQLRVQKPLATGQSVDMFGRIIPGPIREYLLAIDQYDINAVNKNAEKTGIAPATSAGRNIVLA